MAIESAGCDLVTWALETGVWDGILEDSEERLYRKIEGHLLSMVGKDDLLDARLAWLGASAKTRQLIEQELAKPILQPCGGLGWFFRHLWRDHKAEILVGAGIVTAGTTLKIIDLRAKASEPIIPKSSPPLGYAFSTSLLDLPAFSPESLSILPIQSFVPPPGLDLELAALLEQKRLQYSLSAYERFCFRSNVDLNTFSHWIEGEKALEFGDYKQAVQDLSRVIEATPSSPIPYLRRATAHFQLGNYDDSLEDFGQYASQTEKTDLSIAEFSLGFAKGLPKGAYESGKGILLFLVDSITHPIQTSKQVIDSVSMLMQLMSSAEWNEIAEALSPELHQLVTEWETLPSMRRGELAGYALGKHGGDIFAPGAILKMVNQGVKIAPKLVSIGKNFQIAQDTLVLETVTGIGNGAKIGEIVENGQKVASLAKELGFSSQEVGRLKRTGTLETTVATSFEKMNSELQASVILHRKAREALKPYVKRSLPEVQVRELIHNVGIPTFPRPQGIPEDFLVMISNTGAGMEYIHPTNTQIRVRVMPGKLHSPYPCQQEPYVIQMKDGKAFDRRGNLLPHESPEVHVPVNEFVYKE